MSEQKSSESFHSEAHTFDPIQYVKVAYGGPYPDSFGREILEWIMDTFHTLFAGGKSFY